jgi:hypothetical protein
VRIVTRGASPVVRDSTDGLDQRDADRPLQLLAEAPLLPQAVTLCPRPRWKHSSAPNAQPHRFEPAVGSPLARLGANST